MPEAIIQIKNKILEKGKIKELSATLELPAPREQIAQILHGLHVEGAGENGEISVKWLDDNQHSFYELEHDSRNINHVYELNHLMERVSTLGSIERIKLGALCYEFLDSQNYFSTGFPELEPTIANAINLTHNLDGILVIEGIDDYSQLGRHCVNEGLSGFESLSSVKPEYLDFERIGLDYREQLGGSVYVGGFVYNIPEKMQRPYDGKSLLIEPEPDREPEEAPGQTGGITMGGM